MKIKTKYCNNTRKKLKEKERGKSFAKRRKKKKSCGNQFCNNIGIRRHAQNKFLQIKKISKA
jgi:hypothetical protein